MAWLMVSTLHDGTRSARGEGDDAHWEANRRRHEEKKSERSTVAPKDSCASSAEEDREYLYLLGSAA